MLIGAYFEFLGSFKKLAFFHNFLEALSTVGVHLELI